MNTKGRKNFFMKKNESNMDIKCAVVGYGPSFNMGKTHCKFIDDTRGLKLVAICDLNRERLKAAKDDFPSIDAYENLDNMLMWFL